MTDYSTLDNAALRRLIAERLGYVVRVVNIPESNFMHYTIGATDLHMARNGEREQQVPQWSEDANVALTLVDAYFQLKAGRSTADPRLGWRARFAGSLSKWSSAETPARAVCLAWLVEQDRKDATDGTN